MSSKWYVRFVISLRLISGDCLQSRACHFSRRYDRRIVRGVATRVHETGNWSLYVEEDPDLRIPELKDWHWDGIIADFDDRKTAETVRDLKIPIVGIGGGYGWYDDMAVIGVDNDEVMCELTNPPLTSIEQGSRQIGYEAALLLERLMAGKKVPRQRTLLEPENIVVRQSTDILAIEDDTVIPIKHIAERCGFGYLQYFTTVFRQHTGHTPAEYRRGPRA